MSHINHVSILGAGTMGAQIGAHLANAGVPVLLLDVSADAAARGLARARTLRPDPFFVPEAAALIQTGGFDDLSGIGRSDWIVEAVVEDLEIKRPLLARVDEHRAERAIVSSNTSGVSIAALAEGRSAGFRRHWLGTHFFNPPRYLHLLELIPTDDTDPSVTQRLADFADRRLGKGVVIARDTPAFIANRIGLFGMVRLLEALAGGGYTIEEIDAITGPAIGRPKSATFRTADIAGIDVLAHVTRDLTRRLDAGERRLFELPPFVDELVRRGWLGEKTGQGFYKRIKRAGETVILTLDLEALAAGSPDPYSEPGTFRSREPLDLKVQGSEHIRALVHGDDKAGRLLRETLLPTLEYAASVAPSIAHSNDDVDRAMRWGYGWELGPFELRDALSGDRPAKAGPTAGPPKGGRYVQTKPSASLIDLGDGVLGIELHSKMNTVDDDTLAMLRTGIETASARFAAVVLSGHGEHFSAGANLKLLVAAADAGNWAAIESMIRAFQDANMAIKTSPVPVVAAAAGLALGGGCEICLHAACVQAAAETYMGLVELGVGLIPAAGGSKEMLLRTAHPSDSRPLQQAFETVALAKVSTSAADARRLGYLRPSDRVTMNRDRLLTDAKATALAVAAQGYQPVRPRTDVAVGGADTFALLSLGVHLAARAGRASPHDAIVARKLAWVLAGGDAPHRALVSEQHVLDLEREAFLSLCGEAQTLERIRHTLKTGKPLRN
jgi:3-hydroxyacyl-CoA dehydrogenase